MGMEKKDNFAMGDELCPSNPGETTIVICPNTFLVTRLAHAQKHQLTKTANGSGANCGKATTGNGSVSAHSAASAAQTRPKMVFKRTIVPAPSAVTPSGSSTVGTAGAARSRPGLLSPPASTIAPRTALRPRPCGGPTPPAPQPALRPLKPQAPPATSAPVVQPGISWASVAARNAGPSGLTIRVSEQPVTAPPRLPTPAKLARRGAVVAASVTNTFASPLEEGSLKLTGFHPMEALFANQSDGPASSVRSWALNRLNRELHGFSPNYKGNIGNPRNRPLLVDEKDNCSVFITNLPLGMKAGRLLDELTAIGPFGKVYQTHVMEPSEDHQLPSARVCMWDRRSAERVYQAIDVGLLDIEGKTANVRWDIVQKEPHLGQTFLSRVILIRGPAHIVDVESIYEILNELVVYQTQKVSVLWETEEEREIRWIFGSFYAQAEPIRMALSRRWENNPNIYVRCGVDPMEVGLRGMEPSLYDVNPGPDNERKTLPRVDPDAEDENEEYWQV